MYYMTSPDVRQYRIPETDANPDTIRLTRRGQVSAALALIASGSVLTLGMQQLTSSEPVKDMQRKANEMVFSNVDCSGEQAVVVTSGEGVHSLISNNVEYPAGTDLREIAESYVDPANIDALQDGLQANEQIILPKKCD